MSKLRATVHVAHYVEDEHADEWAFINVTNLSERGLYITHVWFETKPQAHCGGKKAFPVLLYPQEPTTFGVRLNRLPKDAQKKPFTLGRVRLSTGEIVKTVKETTIPTAGAVS